jgi:NAD-dependent deacetylase
MDAALAALLDDVAVELRRHGARKVLVLTGAGVSAESGIPTFRGPEGHWTVGSRIYTPPEIATRAAWDTVPCDVWRWYLRLLRHSADAAPNPAHLAIADLDRRLPGRCVTVTQNVDGLHLRAGNDPDRTFAIHGDARFVRCGADCSPDLLPLPPALLAGDVDPEREPSLRCPRCGALLRPHVLFFDESYSERLYRSESALAVASAAALLLVVGTSGATTLPNMVARAAVRSGAAVVDVNPEDDPFAELARALRRGVWVKRHATDALPEICARLIAAVGGP